MSRLRSFLRSSRAERRSLLAALACVASARMLLWVLPYRGVRALLERTAVSRRLRSLGGGRKVPPEQIARDVGLAARLVPRATCLVQVLAAEWLIVRGGTSAAVRFGVARAGAGLEAHAWLESGGRVILGGEGHERFTALGQASGPDA